MQIANDVHKLLVLTQLHIQINEGNLFYVTKHLDHSYCEDIMGSHSQGDLRAPVYMISLIKMNKRQENLRMGC